MTKALTPTRARGLTRRTFGLGTTAAVFTAATPGVWSKASASQRLIVADPGGVFSQAFSEAFYKPFSDANGVEVVGVARRASPAAEFKSMVETKNYIWDVVSIGNDVEDILSRQKLVEPLHLDDPAVLDIPENLRTPHWMGINVIAFVIAYRTDKFGKDGPRTYADIWDRKRFPGRLAIRKEVREAVENAMRAEGIAGGASIYEALSAPGGWERAFKKLDEIKTSVDVWWGNSAQAAQILSSGEVDICPTWNARAQEAVDSGAPVKIEWNEGAYMTEGWSVPKGNPRTDLARKFIAFCAQPERQAAYTKWLAYGPTNPKAYEFVPAERASLLPTAPAHFSSLGPYDVAFWGRERQRAVTLFNEWLIK